MLVRKLRWGWCGFLWRLANLRRQWEMTELWEMRNMANGWLNFDQNKVNWLIIGVQCAPCFSSTTIELGPAMQQLGFIWESSLILQPSREAQPSDECYERRSGLKKEEEKWWRVTWMEEKKRLSNILQSNIYRGLMLIKLQRNSNRGTVEKNGEKKEKQQCSQFGNCAGWEAWNCSLVNQSDKSDVSRHEGNVAWNISTIWIMPS